MNAYNSLAAAKRLEGAGLARSQAEASATEIGDGMVSLVTKEQLRAELDRLLIKIGVMTSGIVALACTVMGVLNAIK